MRKFLAFALGSIIICTASAGETDGGGHIRGWFKEHRPVRKILGRIIHPFRHGGGESEGEGYSEEVPAPRQAEPKPAPKPNPPPRQKKIELSPTEVDGQPSVSYFQTLFAKQQTGQYVSLANEESKATIAEEQPPAEQVQQEECSPQEGQQVQYRPRRRIVRRGGC